MHTDGNIDYMFTKRVLAGAVVACTAVAIAQTAAEIDRDEAEVVAHRLSMDTLNKAVQAHRNLYAVLKADPTIGQRLEKKREEEANGANTVSTNGRMAISHGQRLMESEPKVAAAFKSAGTSVRESLISMSALAIYGMAAFTVQNGGKLPLKGMIPENITFLRQNEAALKEIGAEMQKLGKDMKALETKEEPEPEEEEEPEATPQPSKKK